MAFFTNHVGQVEICASIASCPSGPGCSCDDIFFPSVYSPGGCSGGNWSATYDSFEMYSFNAYFTDLVASAYGWNGAIDAIKVTVSFTTVTIPSLLYINGVVVDNISAPGTYSYVIPVSNPSTTTPLDFSISYENLDYADWSIDAVAANNCTGLTPFPSFDPVDMIADGCGGISTYWEPSDSGISNNVTSWRSSAPAGWEATPGVAGAKVAIATKDLCYPPLTSGLVNVAITFTSLSGSTVSDDYYINITYGVVGDALLWCAGSQYSAGSRTHTFTNIDPSLFTGEIKIAVGYDSSDTVVVTCVEVTNA